MGTEEMSCNTAVAQNWFTRENQRKMSIMITIDACSLPDSRIGQVRPLRQMIRPLRLEYEHVALPGRSTVWLPRLAATVTLGYGMGFCTTNL